MNISILRDHMRAEDLQTLHDAIVALGRAIGSGKHDRVEILMMVGAMADSIKPQSET